MINAVYKTLSFYTP